MGKYLTTAGDCEACHTAPGGQRFAGGLYMNTPFGPISTPNITPDRETGIGNYTDDQFYRLFHQGVNAKGEHIYPVMPFPWYTKVRRDDTLAIKAYLFSLQPVNAPRKPLKLAFPFNVRAGLIGWDAVFLKAGEFKPDPKQSEEVNRGRLSGAGALATAANVTTAVICSATRRLRRRWKAARSTSGMHRILRPTRSRGWAVTPTPRSSNI